MNDLDDDRDGGPPPKRGIPRWAWITCGSGCLLALVTAAVLFVGGYKMVRKGTDPEQQWPKLAAILPFDERPANLTLGFGFSFVQDQFHLEDKSAAVQAVVTALPTREALEQLMTTDPKTVFGFGKPVDPELGELELQGRSVRFLRFTSIGGPGDLGPGIRLDLGQLAGKHRVVELHAHGSAPSDDDVRAFLAPFDVWRER